MRASALEETGPVRFALRIEAGFGASTVDLSVRSYAGDPRLELDLRVDWHERLRVAKLVLTFAARSSGGRTGSRRWGSTGRRTGASAR